MGCDCDPLVRFNREVGLWKTRYPHAPIIITGFSILSKVYISSFFPITLKK